MSLLRCFFTVTDSIFWDLPGDGLAAAESLRGWKGAILSLSLSLV